MSKYPANLDDDSSLPSVTDGSTEISGDAINALKDAILAVQRAIGADPQGVLADLVARLAVSINDDGTLKASALVVAAIVNSQIAAAAGIEESKLALDFSTQFLRDQITSNDIDIQVLQTALAQLIADFSSHHLSGAFPHDSDQILLDSDFPASTPPWLTGISGTTVADAIRELADIFAAHTSPSAVDAHPASSISVSGAFSYITADNVQDALEQLESQRSSELQRHLDDAHSNGISAWENDPLGWNRNLQLYPVSGTAAATVISRYVVDFGSDTLTSFKVVRGEVLVFNDEAYVVSDVGPRAGTGSKPTLDATQLELFRPLPVASGIIQAAIFGRSSVSNLKVALAATVLPGTATADTVLLARPNAAKAVSLGLNPLFIDASCELHLEVSTGVSTSKAVAIENLHLDRTGLSPLSRVSAASIVDRINYVLCSADEGNFIPAAAYVVGSEIAIVHNWSDSADYWLKITAATPEAARGAELCGFGSNGAGLVGFRSYPSITGRFSVNGNVHQDFATYYAGAASISGNTIDIGTTTSQLGILPGHVVHVLTAATHPEVGSYQITAVGPSTVQVGAALTATTAGVVRIDASSVSLADIDGSPNAIISEIFVDRDGFSGAFMRASAQEGISGAELVDVSDSRLAGTETLLGTAPSAGLVALQFNGAADSNKRTVRTSLIGRTRVYDRTGMSWAEFALTGALGTGSTQLEFFDHTDEEEMLEIASVRFFDRKIRAISDRRLFGSLGLDELREDVTQAYVETPLAELRSSGVVRGFSVLTDNVDAASVSSSYPVGTRMVQIDGGVAYVDGVRVEQTSQYVAIPPVDGTYFVCINVGGLFQVVSEADFSLAEIIEGLAGSLVPLLSVERTATPQIESTVVAYNIANIDERVDAVLDLTNNFVGNFSSAAAAIAYLNAYPFEERSRLRIVSRRAASAADDIEIAGLTAPVSISIDGYLRELAVSSDCTVGSDTFAGRAEPHATALSVNTERFAANKLILSSVSIDLAGVTSGSYVFENCEFTEGASITVVGSSGLDALVFKNCSSRGGSFALQCDTTDGSIKISGCSFAATPATSSTAHGGAIDITAAYCSVEDTVLRGVGFTWGGSGAEFNLAVSNLEITDVSVTSTRSGFTCASGHAVINDLRVRRSYRQSGSIVDLGQTVTSRISSLLVDTCEVQFTVGVASLLRGGGESVLDGAVVSELSMPAPASTDPHIAIPNVFGFLYDGPEIISIVADNISESVGVGSASTSGADGITGSSAAPSLQPGVSGLSITANALPVGSGYVLSGSTISGPIGGQSVLVPSILGLTDRGLLQSHVNSTGVLGASYRIQKRPDVSDPLDIGFIKIVDISDTHPLTPSSGASSGGYPLTYSGGELSWAAGEPVTPVLGSTHRLYASDYSGWIDVYIASAPTGSGTDLYRVLPSVRDAGRLLLGHYWWDGSAVLGAPVDRRYFGNVAGNSLADSARAPETGSTADNRGNSIYSGGLVTTDPGIGTDAVRIYGPMTAYVDGRRFTVPLRSGADSISSGRGGYGGITMPYADNYIYVDSSGVLLINSNVLAWPTTAHAKVARVQVAGSVVTDIDDFRSSDVFLAGPSDALSWDSQNKRLSLFSEGSALSTIIYSGRSEAVELRADQIEPLTATDLSITSPNSITINGSSSVSILASAASDSQIDLGGHGTSSGFSKQINIGNNGAAGSTSQINIGTASMGSVNIGIGSGTGSGTVTLGSSTRQTLLPGDLTVDGLVTANELTISGDTISRASGDTGSVIIGSSDVDFVSIFAGDPSGIVYLAGTSALAIGNPLVGKGGNVYSMDVYSDGYTWRPSTYYKQIISATDPYVASPPDSAEIFSYNHSATTNSAMSWGSVKRYDKQIVGTAPAVLLTDQEAVAERSSIFVEFIINAICKQGANNNLSYMCRGSYAVFNGGDVTWPDIMHSVSIYEEYGFSTKPTFTLISTVSGSTNNVGLGISLPAPAWAASDRLHVNCIAKVYGLRIA